jgi:putative transposase
MRRNRTGEKRTGASKPKRDGDSAASNSKASKKAIEREAVIMPLVGKPGRTRSDVASRARQFGRHPNTLYSSLRKYERHPSVSTLRRKKRSDFGDRKLLLDVENIIDEKLHECSEHSTPFKQIANDVASKCVEKGLPAPHYNTVRSRSHAFLRNRDAHPGNEPDDLDSIDCFPAAYPLACVEIGSRPVNVIITDGSEWFTGEGWVTAAVDCFSHTVLGSWISEERPGEFEIGQCIARTILPKDDLLNLYGIEGNWSCHGVPEILLIRREGFQSASFNQTCASYGIRLEWIDGEVKYASCARKFFDELVKAYDPRRVPVITTERFDQRVIDQIVSYNRRLDSEFNVAPITRFEQNLSRAMVLRSIGSFHPIDNAAQPRVPFDFMPSVVKKVRKNGVLIEGIIYSSPSLIRWKNATLAFRRDHRHISKVWFLHPRLNRYLPVRSKGPAMPITWDQYRQLRRQFGVRWQEMAIEQFSMDKFLNSVFRLPSHLGALLASERADGRLTSEDVDLLNAVEQADMYMTED